MAATNMNLMEVDTPSAMTSQSLLQTKAERRLQHAASILTDTSAPNATAASLVTALMDSNLSPLTIYRTAGCLREGQLKELVQHLIFRGPSAAPATARLLLVMHALGGTWELTVDFLLANTIAGALPCFDDRVMTIFAMLGGKRCYSLCDWRPVIERAASEGGDEARLAIHVVLEKRWEGKVEHVLRVEDWASQMNFERSPSFWREIEWASFARSLCMRVDLPIEPRTPALAPSSAENAMQSHNRTLREDLGPEYGPSSQHYVRICGILLRRRGPAPLIDAPLSVPLKPSTLSPEIGVVTTPSIRAVLRDMASSLCYARPFVLEGPSGCGKTTLISHLARMTSYTTHTHVTDAPNVTFIQMDSSMGADGDSFSALIGGIVPLPQGAGFRWRPGPIGLAVERGHWLVLENIGSGSARSSSALPIILQLAALQPGDPLSAPGRGEPLRAGSGFRCIATRTLFDSGRDDTWAPPGGWKLWRHVPMQGLSESEKEDILKERYPTVEDCVPRVVKAAQVAAAFVQRHHGPLMRGPSLRDAIRICERLSQLRGEDAELVTVENALLETLDVLGAWCPTEMHREDIIALLSDCWSLPSGVGQDLSLRHHPLVQKDKDVLRIGRASALRMTEGTRREFTRLSLTGHTARLLERTLRCLQVGEHVLLTGETGSGKTSVIQELASLLGKSLVVVNLSRQSELSDLIGGFRPFELAAAVPQLARKFASLFCLSMSQTKNGRFLDALHSAAGSLRLHHRALRLMRGAMDAIPRATKQRTLESRQQWNALAVDLGKLEISMSRPGTTVTQTTSGGNIERRSPDGDERPRKRPRSGPHLGQDAQIANGTASGTKRCVSDDLPRRHVDFAFVEGVLVRAMREGNWILLDEINLAPPELLERLVSVVDRGQVALPNENGEFVSNSPGFTLFGAMNPPTDVGKRPLPSVLRTRFTEFYVGDMLEEEDIVLLTLGRFFATSGSEERLAGMVAQERTIAKDVASFYVQCCSMARLGHVEDTTGKPMRYSLRTFSRMLDHASGLKRFMSDGFVGMRRSLYEGALVAFATPLPEESKAKVTNIAGSLLLRRREQKKSPDLVKLFDLMNVPPPSDTFGTANVEGFPIQSTKRTCDIALPREGYEQSSFIISPTVRKTLQDVSRAMTIGAPRLPILLQGPTAAGKTSLVAYLARLTGNPLTRINNHEHTDLSEYVGGYVASPDGSLVFTEGPLVRAARDGSWILLDELNLAPPEVLEALNRLLDDNKEIFIAETGEVVKATAGFTVFATQNPPGLYGGRKELSRAFRGRFVEVQVEDLPDTDLLTILERRSSIPQSFARRMIAVMRELQIRRRSSSLFAGRHGFVTARDLFRWASRQPRSREELAVHGFFLLGERARRFVDRELVRSVIVQFVEVSADILKDENLYSFADVPIAAACASRECLDFSLQKLSLSRQALCETLESAGIIATPHMRRMIILLVHSISNSEPALLVGTTGGGKTSACAVLCRALGALLLTVNCHRHTEASDMLGGFRPVRSRKAHGPLFEWVDGPLVKTMRFGGTMLIDEINMADDAVVERLNSVLELERTLLLSEKGNVPSGDEKSPRVESVRAHPDFRILATMNPGGDFGKKELSPALRNRFTEIWIPPPGSIEEYSPIVYHRLRSNDDISGASVHPGAVAICNFLEWSLREFAPVLREGSVDHREGRYATLEPRFAISLRDIAAWCDFAAVSMATCNLDPIIAVVHGARLVFLDGLCVGSTSEADAALESQIWGKLLSLVPDSLLNLAKRATFSIIDKADRKEDESLERDFCLKFENFGILRNKESCSPTQRATTSSFSFTASCTIRNCSRLARAMSVGSRPILLEGPPGCGKSSLVTALASRAGFSFVRVNLSEYTEMSDLVGSDAPGSTAGSFVFRVGPLLNALREGAWLLLDELNLASQSVLEGLNSILDHRRSLYISELDQEVVAHPSFRIFGAQNPAVEGGGRRGLPKSFLNRFTRVQVEAPNDEDVLAIASAMHPMMDPELTSKIIQVLCEVRKELERSGCGFHVGSLGLRDALRWCDMVGGICELEGGVHQSSVRSISSSRCQIGSFFDVTVLQSLQERDRGAAEAAFERVFGFSWRAVDGVPSVRALEPGFVRIGQAVIKRSNEDALAIERFIPAGNLLLPSRFRELQAVACAVTAGWPVILQCDSTTVSVDEGERIVFTLSTLCGKPVTIVHGGTLSDADDFIGGYSQQDIVRTMRNLVAISEHICHVCLLSPNGVRVVETGNSISENILLLETCQRELKRLSNLVPQSGFGTEDIVVSFETTLSSMLAALENLSECDQTLQRLLAQLKDRRSVLSGLLSSSKNGSSTSFEWQKSNFVKAIEKGDWILVQDADACPPAVLDRLNPILERPAVALRDQTSVGQCRVSKPIILAEAPANEDGSPVMLWPHPEFRMFFSFSGGGGPGVHNGISRALLDRSLRVTIAGGMTAEDFNAVVASTMVPRCEVFSELDNPSNLPLVCSASNDSRVAVAERRFGLAVGDFENTSIPNISDRGKQRTFASSNILFDSVPHQDESPCTDVSRFSLSPLTAIVERDIVSLGVLESIFEKDSFADTVSEISVLHRRLELRREQLLCAHGVESAQQLIGRYLLVSGIEAFLMGSHTTDDLLERVKYLRVRAEITSSQTAHQVYQVAARIGEGAFRVVSNASSEDLRGVLVLSAKYAIPLDPVFAMDRLSVSTLHAESHITSFANLVSRAKVFRFEVLALQRFELAWKTASMCQSSLPSESETAFSRAKLRYEVGDQVFSSEVSGIHKYEYIAYAVVSFIVRVLDDFRDASCRTASWEIEEEGLWVQLFLSSAELCDVLRKTRGSGSAAVIAILADVLRLVSAVSDTSCGHLLKTSLPVFKNSQAAMAVLMRAFAESSTITMPRGRECQETELKLLSVVTQRGRDRLSFVETDQVVKALVSISSRTVEDTPDVLALLGKVANIIDTTVAPLENAMILHWGIIARTKAVTLLRKVLLDCSNVTSLPLGEVVNRGFAWKQNILQALHQTKCLPDVQLNTIVSLQHMYWLLDAGHMDNRESVAFFQALRKNLVSCFLTESCVLRGSKPHMDPQRKRTEYGLSSAILLLGEGPPSQFWDLTDTREESLVAASTLAGGVDFYTDSAEIGVQMLRESLFCALSCVGHLSEDHLDSLRTGAGGIRALIAESQKKIRECDGDESQNLYKCQLESLLCFKKVIEHVSDTSAEFQGVDFEGLHYLGSAWVSTGVLRLRSQFLRSEQRLGVDPSAVACARAAHALKAVLLSNASRTSYSTFGRNRLGGDNPQKCAPVDRHTLQETSAAKIVQVADDNYVFRPPNRPSFKSFENAISGVNSSIVERVLSGGSIHRLLSSDVSTVMFGQAREECADIQGACRSTAETFSLGGSLSHFRDLSADIVVGLREVQHGFAFCLQGAEKRTIMADKLKAEQVHLFQDLSLYPRSAYPNALPMRIALQRCSSSTTNAKTLMAFARYFVECEAWNGSFSNLANISSAFNVLVDLWKQLTESEEESEFRKRSLHIIRDEVSREVAPGHRFVEGLEVDEEQDFRDTFNPLGEEIDEALLGLEECREQQSNNLEEADQHISTPKVARPLTLDVDSFWSIHSSVFGNKMKIRRTPDDEVASREMAVKDVSSSLLPFLSNIHVVTNDVQNVWNTFASVHVVQMFDSSTSSDSENCQRVGKAVYNFYRDPNTGEVLLAAGILRKLLQAISKIQREIFGDTGDHPVLAEVSISVERLAKLCTVSSPLSNLVVGIENVLRKADEWRRLFATSQSRMDVEVDNVARVAARWRSLEMKSWPLLLDARVKAQERRSNKWFFFLYDAVIREATSQRVTSNEANRNVIATLDQFLRSAPCGEFGRRLEMITSLGSHLLSLQDVHRPACLSLGLALKGLALFYGQYLSAVTSRMTDAQLVIEKKLTDFAQLVSWKSDEELGSSQKMFKGRDKHLEYYRLKAASDKTRRKLHKLCLEMDSVVRVPVYEYLTKEISHIGFDKLLSEKENRDGTKDSRSDKIIPCSTAELLSSLSTLADRPSVGAIANNRQETVGCSGRRSATIDSFIRSFLKFDKMVTENQSSTCDVASELSRQLRFAIRSRSLQLRASTHLGVQLKKRALVELLKGLQRIGLSPFEGTVPPGNLEPHFWLSAPDPSSADLYNELANELFFTSAQQVRRLKELSDSRLRSSDITGNEAGKARAFCNHLFDFACSQRFSLAKFFGDVGEIATFATALSQVEADCSTDGIVWNTESLPNLLNILQRSKKMSIDLKVSLSMLKSLSEMSSHDNVGTSERGNKSKLLRKHHLLYSRHNLSAQISLLNMALASLDSLLSSDAVSQLSSLSQNDNILFDGHCVRVCSIVHQGLAQVCNELEKNLAKAEQLSGTNLARTILEPTVNFIRRALDELSRLDDSSKATNSTSQGSSSPNSFSLELESTGELLIEKTLIASQHLLHWNGVDMNNEQNHGADVIASVNTEPEDINSLMRPGVLKHAHAQITSLGMVAGTEGLLSILRSNISLLKSFFRAQNVSRGQQEKVRAIAQLQRRLGTFLRVFLTHMLIPSAQKACAFHIHALALLRTLSSLFAGIFSEGFCRPADEHCNETNEGETETHDGTGFGDVGDGDISGAQDVSEQIEDEEQLLGLRDEAQKNEPEKSGDKDEAGMEMTADFDGELEDLDGPDNQDKDEESSPQEDKMSSEPGKGKDIVDERMWDEGKEDQKESERANDVDRDGAATGRMDESELVAKDIDEDMDSRKEQLDGKTQREGGPHPQNVPEEESEMKEDPRDPSQADAQPDMPNKTQKALVDEDKTGEEDVDEPKDADSNAAESRENETESAAMLADTEPNRGDAKASADDEGGQVDISVEEGKENADEEAGKDDVNPNDSMTGVEGDAEGLRDSEEQQGDEAGVDKETHDIPDDLALEGLPDIDQEACETGVDGMNGDCSDQSDGLEDANSTVDNPQEIPQVTGEDVSTTEEQEGAEHLEYGVKDQSGQGGEQEERSRPSMDLDTGTATTNQRTTNNERGQEMSAFQAPNPKSALAASGKDDSQPVSENVAEDQMDGDTNGPQTGGKRNNSDSARRAEGAVELGETDLGDNASDPNPLRASSTDELISRWSRSLEILQRGDEGPSSDPKPEQNDGLKNSLWEFKNEGEGASDDVLAMGAATDEQHHPLPEDSLESEDNDERREGRERKSNEKDDAFRGSDGSKAVPQIENVDVPNKRPLEKEESTDDQLERDDREVRINPARLAVEASQVNSRFDEGASNRKRNMDGEEDANDMMSKTDNMELEVPVSDPSEAWVDKRVKWDVEDLNDEDARELWHKLDIMVSSGASTLCEQLRLVLEPTIASGLAGGYRTGKRLNMRKVIEFVASDFRKDRIWLRRVRPDKRSYDVLIAIDDSESMSESEAGPMAIESLALVTSALSKLEIGRLAVASFGRETKLVRDFDEPLPLSAQKGGELLKHFSFAQTETNVSKLLSFIQDTLGENLNSMDAELIKLAFVVSDGRLSGREEIKRQLRQLKDRNVLVAFIIVDKLRDKEASIYDVRRVEYDEKGRVKVLPYMQGFPVEFFAVVQDVQFLPTVLADSLRQWMEMTSAQL